LSEQKPIEKICHSPSKIAQEAVGDVFFCTVLESLSEAVLLAGADHRTFSPTECRQKLKVTSAKDCSPDCYEFLIPEGSATVPLSR
jgi:hypothetical protein